MEEDNFFIVYANDIYRYLLSLCQDHHLSEDLLQETFYRAYLHINELNPENIKPWLFRVSHNLFIDYLRKNKRLSFMSDEQLERKTDNTNIEKEVITNEKLKGVVTKINLLPPNQKYAVILCDINDLNYKECAEVMGVTVASFKSTLYRARQSLRKLQNKEEGLDDKENQ